MEDSYYKISISKTQNKILKKLFENIDSDSFNLDVDLGEFDANELNNFWIYTSGFLSVQNFEAMSNQMSHEEIDDIMEGKFKLKSLSNEEANALAESVGKSFPKSGVSHFIDLYNIQDGTYTVNKTVARHYLDKRPNWLSLKTDGVKFYTDNPNPKVTTEQALNILRNLMVHSAPVVNGSHLIFLDDEQDIEITRMWLRGYSELFSQKQKKVDAEDIEETLSKELSKTGNYIENPEQLDKALSLIKNLFDQDVISHYFRINNFAKVRVQYFDNFYQKSLDEKIKIIASICSNNSSYITASNGTIEPAIIYNIQQLVAKELSGRGEQAMMSEDDYATNEFIETHAEFKKIDADLEKFEKNITNKNSAFAQAQIKRLIARYGAVKKKLEQQLKQLENRQKLESTHAEIYNLYGLEHLPVEVAVNIVCLMGYNSLVTSAFYEDLLANNSGELNNKQKQFFKNFNLSNINVKFYDKPMNVDYSPEEKMYILTCIRNAICHNNIKFVLPPAKKNGSVDFKDVEINFTADWDRAKISGKLIDFYKLFGSDNFTKERISEIITRIDKTQTDSKIEEENIKNKNDNGQPGDE